MPRLKRANRGKKAAWPELEVDLLKWITEKQWSRYFTIVGQAKGPRHGKEREIWDSRRAV